MKINRKRNECLYCKELVRGRIDKKFCNDNCRNSYNNQVNRHTNNFVRRINRILSKNRRLLKEFNPNGKARVTRERLLSAGFNFSYYTNVYQTKAGKVYYFVYDQGYLKIGPNQYALVEKLEYVD